MSAHLSDLDDIYSSRGDITWEGPAMSRTLVDVDDDALRRAAAVLGTTTKVETINRALRLVAESAGRQAERDRFNDLIDEIGDALADTNVRAEAWR
jgi:Arc/MetJ family transcription regulator